MTRARRPAAAVVVTLGAATLLAGCSLLGGTGVFSLEVGDCIESTDLDTAVETVPVIECDEPHESEVYASFRLDDGEFPGTEAITSEAEDLCIEAFEDFVGLAYADSALDATTMTPTEESWGERDDREVLCLVSDPDAAVTGTLQDADR